MKAMRRQVIVVVDYYLKLAKNINKEQNYRGIECLNLRLERKKYEGEIDCCE